MIKISLLIWITLLISATFALFEWVHPDEWQPEHKVRQESVFDEITEKASHAKETLKETGHNVVEGTKELGEDIGHKFQELRKYGSCMINWTLTFLRSSREDLYEPMVRMMKHALNVFEEEDRFMENPIPAAKHGWPSRFETNPKIWREYPDEFLLFVDVPGIPRSELSCNITRNHLVIFGQHGACLRPAKTAQGEERFCLERGIMETIRLPEDVNAEHLQCKFKDGILIVQMPKTAVHGMKVPVQEYKPSWSERAKDVKDSIMEKVGIHHERPPGAESPFD